ncbi:hypothetical protein TWF970_003773 [Orbilia oligospora]|uniref:Uncharacterized protein n=1 Tax=Orbilia oligospora TaxID=2813651 RepID=A0A7C8RE50_ORBOL|nr:hypothetical protein TWF970_003773 [Orbilia oligospora]
MDQLQVNMSMTLPPYTPSHPTKFELSYPPPTLQNPITPIYRSQSFLPPLSDGSPPEYRHSLQTIDSTLKPAYILHFDASTKNTILKTPEGQKVTSISFLKPRRQTVTTFLTSDVDAQTLAGSSFTLRDDEDDDNNEDVQEEEEEEYAEEVNSILLDPTVPAKQTITLSSHKYFHTKGTKFTTKSGTSYRWQKSINPSSTPSISSIKGIPKPTALPHSTFVLTRTPPKSQRTPGSTEIVGRIKITEGSSLKAMLELKGGQEELPEAMFLGSAIAVLKKLDLKAARQKAQRSLPQNLVQITF